MKREPKGDIISVEKHHRDFSIIANSTLRDRDLSLKATGLLGLLISYPSDWKINLNHLCGSKPDGRDSFLSGLAELSEAGYLIYLRWRGEDGSWASRYIVFETPDLKEDYLKRMSEEDLAKITTPSNPNKSKKKTKAESEATTENPLWINGNPSTDSPLRESRNGKPEQTKYIYTNTDHKERSPRECVYLTRAQEEIHTPEIEKIQKPNPEATEQLTPTQIVNLEPVQNIQESGKGHLRALPKNSTIKYDSALGMRPPAPKVNNLIPEGDWLNEAGQLDPNFVRHVAKQWQESPSASFHKMPIEEVEGHVFAHFAKNHPNLVIRWEAYSKVSLRHAEGVKTRLDAGISIPESEQQQIINEGRAIASALNQPEEEKAVPSLPTQEDRRPFGFVLPEATVSQPKEIAPSTPQPTPEPESMISKSPRRTLPDWFTEKEATQLKALLKKFPCEFIGSAGEVDEPPLDLLIDQFDGWDFYQTFEPGFIEARCQDAVFSVNVMGQDCQVCVAEAIASIKAITEAQQPVENSNAYKSPEATKTEDFDFSEESIRQQKDNLDRLNGMIRSQLKITPPYSGQKNKRAMASFPCSVAEANQWLSDPCLRSQAVLWAKREGYAVDYTPEGVAIEIYEF